MPLSTEKNAIILSQVALEKRHSILLLFYLESLFRAYRSVKENKFPFRVRKILNNG